MHTLTPIAPSQRDLFPGLATVLAKITRSHPADKDPVRQALQQLSQPWRNALSAGLPVSPSLLTPTGYPLEFNFSTASTDICYTAEPGLPQDPVALKWQRIQQFCPGFALDPFPLVQLLAGRAGQRYGCWISFRHLSTVRACKVYQEVTSVDYPVVLADLHSRLPGLEKVPLIPRLVGVFPGKEQVVEYYCGLEGATKKTLQALFQLAGQGSQLPIVLCLLGELAGEQIPTLLNRLRLGVSVRFDGYGIPTLTFFVHAAQLFSDNKKARKALLRLAGPLAGSFRLLEHLTADDEKPASPFAYSVVSWKLDPSGTIDLGVGWSPAAL